MSDDFISAEKLEDGGAREGPHTIAVKVKCNEIQRRQACSRTSPVRASNREAFILHLIWFSLLWKVGIYDRLERPHL